MTDGGLKAIFLEQRPILLRLLSARLRSADEAEDALQDMWLRLDRLADQPISHPAALLYRIAANLATDRRIAHSRRGSRDAAWAAVQPEADEMPDAERAAIAHDTLGVIESAIVDMPDRMRIALRMFRFEGRSQREVAQELGITVSGVEKLLQRAYRQIHDRLEPSEDDAIAYRLSGERGPNRAS